MEVSKLSGFRICVELCLEENVASKKCYIFINKKWLKISDVQDHLRSIFNIDSNIDIYVGDVWLPQNETIKVIQPDDILIIKFQGKGKHKLKCKPNKSKVKEEPELDIDNEMTCFTKVNGHEKLQTVFEELESKREQLLKENNIYLQSTSNDYTEGDPLLEILNKSKRKRKHKKKNKFPELQGSEEVYSPESNFKKRDCRESNHIYFKEEDNKLNGHLVENEKGESKNVVIEAIRSSMTKLINKPLSEKTFSYSAVPEKLKQNINAQFSSKNEVETDANNMQINLDKTVLTSTITSPNIGDIIAFKKMKLGEDYTPQQSNEIVGEVLNIEEAAGSCKIVFSIKEGAEEFEDPSGKFSMGDENDKGDKVQLAEMNWHEVLEPHFKKRMIQTS